LLIISAKPVGVGAALRLWIAKGQIIWVVAAERDGQRFIVHADEKLTAFVELEAAIRRCGELA